MRPKEQTVDAFAPLYYYHEQDLTKMWHIHLFRCCEIQAINLEAQDNHRLLLGHS